MQHSLEEILVGMRSADPAIRDGWAYSELAAGIQSGRFKRDHDVIRASALHSLKSEDIYARAFAPLILRWLVLAGDHDAAAFDDFATWYATESDTRGYDETLGWLHAAAHGADYITACVEKNVVIGTRALYVLAQRVCAPGTSWADQEDARIVAALTAALAASEADVEAWCGTVNQALDDFELLATGGGIKHPPTWLSNVYHVETTLYLVLHEARKDMAEPGARMWSHAADVIRRMTPWLFETA